MSIYSNYCKARDAAGMTDYQVSKTSGVSPSTFSDWKTGRSEPKLPRLVKIADAVGVTLQELLKDVET